MKWLIVRQGHEIYMMILKQFTMPESREVLKSKYTKETISDKSPVHDFPIIYEDILSLRK